ncbi:ABC transporter ATP-binding protein [Demequina sp. SO4-13]|uniref:ABC transporter ATP-binding protein n=1 Tax=Demequina sp. SO4-13 TaxID=3401027 RepID=UPI003AF50DFF
MSATSSDTPRLELRGMRKYFAASGVLAVADVSLEVAPGEVVALIGENGTGKSTLMHLLFGVHDADAGEVLVDGAPVTIRSQQDAIDAGLGMVQQHFALVPGFTVAQNVLLGREPRHRGFYDDASAVRRVQQLIDDSGMRLDARSPVRDLPVGAQQRVEILKALAADAQLLILDEPTAVLTPAEAEELIGMVRTIAAQGRSVVFISHKLPEVQSVADRIVVMRRGRIVGEVRARETSNAELARMMVGREVLLETDLADEPPGDVVLAVQGVSRAPSVQGSTGLVGVDLELRAGEVVGIAGVDGNGQDELVDTIAGLTRPEAGRIVVCGQDISKQTPAAVRGAGLAHIASDRMHVGLNLDATLEENAVATHFRDGEYSRRGAIRRANRRQLARRIIDNYEVRGGAPANPVRSLSGGNLQKVVIGRELDASPRVVIANQPTRGLDVGSIQFVHSALSAARHEGCGILLVSAELDEVLALSDRIAVMYDGRLVGPFDRSEATRDRIGRIMAGGEEAA